MIDRWMAFVSHSRLWFTNLIFGYIISVSSNTWQWEVTLYLSLNQAFYEAYRQLATASILRNIFVHPFNRSRLILITQAWKQTLPPSDSDTVLYVSECLFDCKYLSCKICFNVINYVFILFIFNDYYLINIQQHCHNSSHCDWRHHI